MTTTVQEISASRVTGKGGTPALLCAPKAAGTYPCVIILHERYGLTPHTEDLARRIASEGFVVLAPDLFHAFHDIAALRAGEIYYWPTDHEVQGQCEEVFALFSTVAGADTSRFGMVGVCQTGRYPLVWAAHKPIQAAVVLYGAAMAVEWEYTERHPDGIDKHLDKISQKTTILGVFGEGDHVIPLEAIHRFRNAIEDRKLSYQITVYADVPHGWLNDTMPGRYREAPAKAAFAEIMAFLKARLAAGANGHESTTALFRSTVSSDYDFSKNVRQH